MSLSFTPIADLSDTALLRYSRHILLNEIGIEGQQRIAAARVLIVGAGGLGSPAALYLASSGVGTITLADHDTVEVSNLQRQILHTVACIGQPKVNSGAAHIKAINPDVQVIPLITRLSAEQLEALVPQQDVVLDCSDNFATRHAINRACVASNIPLVSGAAIEFEGQLIVFDPRNAASPCYHCVFSESEEIEQMRCAVMGVFAPLTGIIGTMQAAETLKLIVGIGSSLIGRLLMLDARSMQFTNIQIHRNPHCAVCGVAY